MTSNLHDELMNVQSLPSSPLKHCPVFSQHKTGYQGEFFAGLHCVHSPDVLHTPKAKEFCTRKALPAIEAQQQKAQHSAVASQIIRLKVS